MSELEKLRLFRKCIEDMVLHDEDQRYNKGMKVVSMPKLSVSVMKELRRLLDDTA